MKHMPVLSTSHYDSSYDYLYGVDRLHLNSYCYDGKVASYSVYDYGTSGNTLKYLWDDALAGYEMFGDALAVIQDSNLFYSAYDDYQNQLADICNSTVEPTLPTPDRIIVPTKKGELLIARDIRLGQEELVLEWLDQFGNPAMKALPKQTRLNWYRSLMLKYANGSKISEFMLKHDIKNAFLKCSLKYIRELGEIAAKEGHLTQRRLIEVWVNDFRKKAADYGKSKRIWVVNEDGIAINVRQSKTIFTTESLRKAGKWTAISIGGLLLAGLTVEFLMWLKGEDGTKIDVYHQVLEDVEKGKSISTSTLSDGNSEALFKQFLDDTRNQVNVEQIVTKKKNVYCDFFSQRHVSARGRVRMTVGTNDQTIDVNYAQVGSKKVNEWIGLATAALNKEQWSNGRFRFITPTEQGEDGPIVCYVVRSKTGCLNYTTVRAKLTTLTNNAMFHSFEYCLGLLDAPLGAPAGSVIVYFIVMPQYEYNGVVEDSELGPFMMAFSQQASDGQCDFVLIDEVALGGRIVD